MGVFLAWFVAAGIQTVRDVRYLKRAPVPSEYVASGALFGGLSLLGAAAPELAGTLAWGFLVAMALKAGSPSKLVSGGFPKPLAKTFSPSNPNATTLSAPATPGSVTAPVAQPGTTPKGGGCKPPATLVTRNGVTLTAACMVAFQAAQALARARGFSIQVGMSYRSCTEQQHVCIENCGNPNGCPDSGALGTPCARPGTSMHQFGRAIDVRNYQQAWGVLQATGWCHPLAVSDPEHFSWPTCG